MCAHSYNPNLNTAYICNNNNNDKSVLTLIIELVITIVTARTIVTIAASWFWAVLVFMLALHDCAHA